MKLLAITVIIVGMLLWLYSLSWAKDDNMTLLQLCLHTVGANPGPIDGVNGPRTAMALHHYSLQRFGPSYWLVPQQTRAAVLWIECGQPQDLAVQHR